MLVVRNRDVVVGAIRLAAAAAAIVVMTAIVVTRAVHAFPDPGQTPLLGGNGDPVVEGLVLVDRVTAIEDDDEAGRARRW